MNLSFQPPEEDDPRDDDPRHNEERCLPCPFCGNDKNIAVANEKHDHSGGYFIACPACESSTGLRYACGDDPRPLLVAQWNRRSTDFRRKRGHMGSTPDGGFDDHDESEFPESLFDEVDAWFAQNTGLGGCSDKDVSELAGIFFSVTHGGGRESVDDALAVVDSFGPGVDGLNDTYARQVLLAQEVRRLRNALRTACDHIEMDALRISHCKDAAAIDSAMTLPNTI